MLFPYFVYFVYIAHFTKFTCGSSLIMEKSKTGKKSLVKKEKKNRSKEERKSTILSRKEKKFLCKSDQCWLSSTLASRLQTKKSSSNQNVSYIYTDHFPVFPFLPWVLPSPVATLLIIVQSSSTLHRAIEKEKEVSEIRSPLLMYW